MAKNTVWHDDYWLLLMQIFLQKPVGMKPLYSRAMVDLSLELHIAPQVLHSKMQQIARLETLLSRRRGTGDFRERFPAISRGPPVQTRDACPYPRSLFPPHYNYDGGRNA